MEETPKQLAERYRDCGAVEETVSILAVKAETLARTVLELDALLTTSRAACDLACRTADKWHREGRIPGGRYQHEGEIVACFACQGSKTVRKKITLDELRHLILDGEQERSSTHG